MPTVRLLGPVDVIDDHGVVHTPGSPLRCTLLSLLALQPCTAVDTERLLDRIWDGRPPASGLRALRFHISRLRSELGIADLIVTVGSAYRLDAKTDLVRLADGLAFDTDADALAALLATRRGDPFLGASACSALDHERRRLDELTLTITERRYQYSLAEDDTSVIGDLTRLCLDHPVRESLWALLIRAHYQAGNQADALRAATTLRINLRDELGVDPSRELQQLELQILDHDVPPAPTRGTPGINSSAASTLPRPPLGHSAGGRWTHSHVPRPRLDLEGSPDPIDACGLLWSEEVVAVRLPRRLGDAALSSCVGREHELEVLREAWASVVAGRRRLALVSGEPGIGKTRLVAELASTADASAIAYGWCDQDTSAAYFPWVTIVRSLARSHPDVLAEAVAPALATEIHRLVSELCSQDLPVAGDASITRMYLFDAIDTFLAAVSARHPLLVVLDDLHWADGGTLAIIRHLMRSDRDEPLLIVGTYRDTDVDRTHPLTLSLHDLQREPGTVRVSLSGLEHDSVGALIADRAGHAASQEFVDLIYDETEGNPYFTEEVLTHLAESGGMEQDVRGDWVNTMPLVDVGVPEGIRDALGRRLSRLPAETNEVLSVAAVAGREFDLVVVGEVLSLALLDVIERLEPALDAGLVRLDSGSNVGTFAHALVRESLLGEMRSTRRTRVHWSVGRSLGSRAGVAPAVVAHHLCEGALAGDVGEAVAAALDAAAAADRLGASEDVSAWSERAIDVLGDAADQYPELHILALYTRGSAQVFSRSLDAPPSTDLVEATALALNRGDYVLALRALTLAIRATPLPPVVETLAVRAVDEAPAGSLCAAIARGLRAYLAAVRGRPFAVADVDPAIEALDAGIPPELSWYLRDSFLELLLGLPDLERCLDVHLSTIAFGERHDSPTMIGMANAGLSWLAARCGDRVAMVAASQRVRTTMRGGGWNSVYAVDISLAMADGRLDDAEVLISDASTLVGPDSPLMILFDYQFGVLAHLRGSHGVTAGVATSRFPRFVNPPWEVARRSARDGDWKTATSSLASLMAHSAGELHRPLPIMNVLVSVAEAAGLVRDVDRAAMLIPELVPYAGQMAIGPILDELKFPVSSILGRLRALTGDPDRGIADCEAGQLLATAMHTPLLAAESSMVLADVLVLRGRDTDTVRARELVTDAIGVADSCGAYGVVDMGRRLLDSARPS